jgi:sigma-B regulation protein RsbQ
VPPDATPLGQRHHLTLLGGGPATLLFVHGYGCNQAMWRHVAPALAHRWRIALMDLAGFGLSAPDAYDPVRHASLAGHAQDVAAVARLLGDRPLVLVGHSVGAMVGLHAQTLAPEAIAAHAMVAPSACFLEEADWPGGFEAATLEALLAGQQRDMAAWAADVAQLVAGQGRWGPATTELVASFCRADPRAAAQLARATFLGDHRALLPLAHPSLILQCDDDPVAPLAMGRAMQSRMPDGCLRVLGATGHCPHLTVPRQVVAALQDWLLALQRTGVLPAADHSPV